MRMLLAILLVAPGEALAAPLAEQRVGDITARLHVLVGEQPISPGRAQARYRISLEGPPALQVDAPRLEDAFAAWRIAWQTSSWSAQPRAEIDLTLGLVQVKPGVVPLPGVRLRVRGGPQEAWADVFWPDPLHALRDVPPIIELPPLAPSPWPGRLQQVALGLAVVLAGLFLARAVHRWRAASRRPLPPAQRALNRLEVADLDIEQITHIVRDFLHEQAALPTAPMTTPELVAALGQQGVKTEQIEAIRRLLEQGDLVKFAGQPATAAEITQAHQIAGSLIRALATWPGGETAPTGEGG